jgi:hypothetical protein
MAERKTKDARPGRVTPKGGPPKRKVAGHALAPAGDSGRYTAPIPQEFKTSHWSVPALMLAFFGAGILVIMFNYLNVFWNTSNVFLFVGLGLIVAGFITSTRWH